MATEIFKIPIYTYDNRIKTTEKNLLSMNIAMHHNGKFIYNLAGTISALNDARIFRMKMTSNGCF